MTIHRGSSLVPHKCSQIAFCTPGRVSEKLENLETRFEEKTHSLEAKEEAREKSILDLKNDNFKLCEEIRFDFKSKL